MTQDRPSPSGTVTFLFSDIEGSSRLEREVGTELYAELLARHRAILRAAFGAHGGVEQGTEGDSFFVVFPSAAQAVRAAVEAQLGLAAGDWPEGRPVRVRMGLHTGEATRGDEGYVGIDINRAARIAAAGHGGQVVVSAATRGLVGETLPAGVAWRELGSYRLKDFPEPERLSQLVIPGLPADFPPLRTIDARPNSLPAAMTTFVGRERELADGTAPAGHDPAADDHRAGRHRQDPLRPRAGRAGRGRLPGRDLLRPVRARRRPDARPGRDRPGGRHRRGRRPAAARAAHRAPRRPAGAARPGQLRAADRGGTGHRADPAGRPGHPRRGDYAGAPPPVGRAGVPARRPVHAARPPAAHPGPAGRPGRGRCRPGRARAAARVRRDPPVRRAGDGRPAELPARSGQRRHDRPDLCPSRWDAAGHRAGRGPRPAPVARCHPGPAGDAVRAAGLGGSRRARAPADPARRDRLELRPARRPEPAPAGAPVLLRRRLGSRDRRAGLRSGRRARPRRLRRDRRAGRSEPPGPVRGGRRDPVHDG